MLEDIRKLWKNNKMDSGHASCRNSESHQQPMRPYLRVAMMFMKESLRQVSPNIERAHGDMMERHLMVKTTKMISPSKR
jgi:hypothetical protein